MNAKLYLKSSSTVHVQDLKVIRQKTDNGVIETSDFTGFFYSPTCCCSFVGKPVVTLLGDELLHVEFY